MKRGMLLQDFSSTGRLPARRRRFARRFRREWHLPLWNRYESNLRLPFPLRIQLVAHCMRYSIWDCS